MVLWEGLEKLCHKDCLFVEGEQGLKHISSFEAPRGVFLKVGVGSEHHLC